MSILWVVPPEPAQRTLMVPCQMDAAIRGYRYCLETLQEWKEQLGARVYAYCLMISHVHLVVAPAMTRRVWDD
jgi:REP element-mobilizing transposase RayT